jgi:hypothetical protein
MDYKSLIAALVQEHTAIEVGLDGLAAMIQSGNIDPEAIRRVIALNALHYSHEEQFLTAVQAQDPRLAGKLRAQHDEAAEIAGRLNESVAAGESPDALYLTRRFVAIAEHNIIEEERDVFPLAWRFFPPGS